MSLLVRYALSSPDAHEAQTAAMKTLVADLKSAGIAGLDYTCFSTEDPTEFVGILEFPDDATKQSFLDSGAFATYREAVKPHLANPPNTTEITAVASTRD